MTENDISYKVLGAVFKVYNKLGPGLLESVYERVLVYELEKQGLSVKSQVPIKVVYDNNDFGTDLRADIIVEDKVIIELKSVEVVNKVFFKQLQTYLRLTNKRLGLLINFNTDNILKNFHRVINGKIPN